MSATLKILLPDATTNYIKNPALRYDTSVWTAAGATLTRTTDYARFNIASLKVVTAGAALHEGGFYRVSALSGISDNVTVSAYVRGSGVVRIRLHDTFGSEWSSAAIALRSDRWQRISVSGQCSGSNDVRLYVESDGAAAQAITFYVDGAQMERKAYATSYCDGDQPGCRWNIMNHGSHSSRDAYTRKGGRWVELSGPNRELEDLYMTVAGGLGMPPTRLNTQDYAMAPGAFFQSEKVLSRPMTFTFHAKYDDAPPGCVSLDALHELRQALIDAVKSDRSGINEPFCLEYQDGELPLYIWVRYEGGLEGEWDVRNQWVNSFPMRVLAIEPMWGVDDQDVLALGFSTIVTMRTVMGRVNGQWTNLSGGLTGGVTIQDVALALGKQGELIVGGEFTTATNDPPATHPALAARGIAYFDGQEFYTFGGLTGISLGTVSAIAVAPNGDVYIGGSFANVGGVAANRIAYWDASAGAWNALGTGLNGNVDCLAIAPDGDVYVGGNFTDAGGVTAHYIARWDGGSWHALGTYAGLNSYVNSIAITRDGSQIYVGGNFTDERNNPGSGLYYIAAYDPVNEVFSALGAGMNAEVLSIDVSDADILYLGGDFTQTQDGLLTLPYIASWNGQSFQTLGGGVSSSVTTLKISKDGGLFLIGGFSEASSFATGFTFWDGTAYIPIDMNIGTSLMGIEENEAGDIFVGVQFAGNFSTKCSSITYVTNKGSAEAHPTIYIQGPGLLRWLENQTTKARIYLNIDVLEDEEIFIDTGKATIESTIRGNLNWAVLGSSDVHGFSLAPGENKIAAFMRNDVNGYMQISYQPRHWSADATNQGEEL